MKIKITTATVDSGFDFSADLYVNIIHDVKFPKEMAYPPLSFQYLSMQKVIFFKIPKWIKSFSKIITTKKTKIIISSGEHNIPLPEVRNKKNQVKITKNSKQ